jgi:transposase-like protein
VNSIITFLIQFNQSLLLKIDDLLKIIEELTPKHKDYNPKSPKYKKLDVDKPPIVKDFFKLDYQEVIKQHKELWGKTVKPVKSRGGTSVPKEITCPFCGAPHKYLYDNSGGRGQILCKVCSCRFSRDKEFVSPVSLFCPYCGRSLSKIKTRKGFSIHKCINDGCDFYRTSLKKLSPEDSLEYDSHPERFKLRYLYREFHLKFSEMELYSMPKGSVNLNFRGFSPHVLGLCLTYTVNLGLSSRATQRALLEIHGIRISHVTVSKYAKTAAAIVQPFVDSFDYKPSSSLAADETYVKVKGVNHYIWFVMDVIKKSILGYSVSEKRTLEPCLKAMRMAFDKFAVFPGMALKFIADGYSIYKLAQVQFALEKMEFPLTQVIGLTNDDPVSTEYRWFKQIMERLNRTFKFSYRVTNGYGNIKGADTHVALFVAFYNFLRPHPYNYWRPLNQIPELEKLPNMPAKWQKLIELSQKHLLTLQNNPLAS